MLNDRIIRALEVGAFKESSEDDTKAFVDRLHEIIIPLKMQIISKMYDF